jgi:ubiquitin carboxyl-terminal hydrolase 4/11/15
LLQQPYKIQFKDITGYWDECHYCGEQRCNGCTVPYSDEITIEAILTQKLKLKSNNTLFTDDYKSNGKELIIKVVWNQAISKSIFAFLSQAQPMPKHFLSDQDEEMTEAGVSLQDCLREFKQVETLDEDNMWYCNKCKEFVQATKSLEVFKVPRVLIISLKRFKQSKSKYSWGGGGKKLDTFVNFPLEGLDMSPYVLS